MILTIDIGNTLTKIGLFEDKCFKPKCVSSFPTNHESDIKNVQYSLEKFLNECNININDIYKVSISSVVENCKNSWIQVLEKNNLDFLICDYEGVKNIDKNLYSCAYAKPKEVGGDIISACIAANSLDLAPCVIIDFGTATNINVINKNRELEGAIICSGLKTTLDAITDKASALPKINIQVPEKLIGNSTPELIQSGAVYGEAARTDGLIDYINEEYLTNHNVICTGGLSTLISPLLKHQNNLIPNLILQGLYNLAINC